MCFSKTGTVQQKRPVTSLKYTRREINHLHFLNHPIQTLHKCLMRGVCPDIVLPIGLVLELNHKDMRESILQSLDRVVLTPRGSLDVWFLRCGMNAILPKIEHAGTRVFDDFWTGGGFELELDDMDDGHFGSVYRLRLRGSYELYIKVDLRKIWSISRCQGVLDQREFLEMTKYMAEEMVGTSSRPIDTVSGKMCRGGLPIRVIITVV